ncbi:MAG: CE1 family esterase [Planctomycetota bacterium]|jgi:polyhydroxybutyrate depolymerase
MLRSFPLAFAGLLATFSAAAPSSSTTGGTALTTHTLLSGGLLPSYHVACPEDLAPGALAPVAVCFHGAGGDGPAAAQNFGFLEEALARGWIAVFPDGAVFPSEPGLTSWNAGDCCGPALEQNVDDVGFFADLLQDLSSELPVDLERVCVAGFSNGGMLTYRIGSDRPDLVAAIAPVAASLQAAPPQAPLPTVSFFGFQDGIVPFEGGLGGGDLGGGALLFDSQVNSLTAVLLANQSSAPQLVLQDPTALAWVAPGAATTAYFLALDGGHTWPGQSNPSIEPLHATYAATPLIFDFFEVELGQLP